MWIDYDAKGGHGGIDYLTLCAFFDSALKKQEPPIDVYDTAAYMSIAALTEQSIILGGAPVAIPDFTNGRWYNREKKPESKYAL